MTSVLLEDAHGISVVDFKPFLDGSAKEDVAKAILDSFKRVGFVYLVNHGIPPEKSKAMFEWVRHRNALVASNLWLNLNDAVHSQGASSPSQRRRNSLPLIPPQEPIIGVSSRTCRVARGLLMGVPRLLCAWCRESDAGL